MKIDYRGMGCTICRERSPMARLLTKPQSWTFEGPVTRVFHVIASWRAGKTDLKSDRRKEGKDDLSAGQGSIRVRFDD